MLLYENYSSGIGGRYVYSNTVQIDLIKKGHVLKPAYGMMTTCQFVVQKLEGTKDGLLVAVSDPRKGGSPAGY